MDPNKDYKGKILKVYFKYNGKEYSNTGIVYEQEKAGDKFRFSMLLMNGQEWKPPYGAEIIKTTSVRLDETLRNALKDFYKAKVEHKAFLANFWREKGVHERNVEAKLKALKEHSGELNYEDVSRELEALFNDKFAERSSGYNRKYFHCSSVSTENVVMDHAKEIEKYATPEEYPDIIRREYDGELFIRDNSATKKFCEEYAPPEISELKRKVKTEVYASIGDKNFLCVHRSYEFTLKHGLTRKSLDELKDRLFGTKGLDEKIQSASGRAGKTAAKGRDKEPCR